MSATRAAPCSATRWRASSTSRAARLTREYYINDAGAQVDVLARSAFLRYREALGEEIGSIPEGLYPGDYLKPVGEALAREFGAALRDRPEPEWLPVARKRAIDAMMAMIRDDLAALHIAHEVFASERALTGADGGPDRVREAIDALRAKGLVYEGRLPPPKGAPSDDWEDREQTLFRSTEFGDDVDRPLIKSDGGYTYFASDIAYHKTKIDRGFLTLVDVWGADHGGYVKRMQAAVAALSDDKARLEVRLCQLVRLMRAGEPVKMSKRSGDFVTLREVVDEVGADAVRFIMLMRKNDATLDFDLAKVIEQSQDNPVFYVQYAHARVRSVLRQGQAAFPDLDLSPAALAQADLSLLTDEGERDLMRTLAQYPRTILQAARRTNRTGSRFSPTSSPRGSTPTGIGAKICGICASLMKTIENYRMRDCVWWRRSASFWPPRCQSWGLAPPRRCASGLLPSGGHEARRGAYALTRTR